MKSMLFAVLLGAAMPAALADDKRKLQVDPVSAQILSERDDD